MTQPNTTPVPIADGKLYLIVTDGRVSLAAHDRLFDRACVVTLGTEGARELRSLLDTLGAPQGQEVQA